MQTTSLKKLLEAYQLCYLSKGFEALKVLKLKKFPLSLKDNNTGTTLIQQGSKVTNKALKVFLIATLAKRSYTHLNSSQS